MDDKNIMYHNGQEVYYYALEDQLRELRREGSECAALAQVLETKLWSAKSVPIALLEDYKGNSLEYLADSQLEAGAFDICSVESIDTSRAKRSIRHGVRDEDAFVYEYLHHPDAWT
jgi:hypothetical protein